jgi:hypothetical protein
MYAPEFNSHSESIPLTGHWFRVSHPAKLPGLPCLRSIASNGSCLAGFGFRQRAQQLHQTLNVRGGTSHQLLDQDLRMAATARTTTTVTIRDFSQFTFHFQMLAPDRRVLRRLRFRHARWCSAW